MFSIETVLCIVLKCTSSDEAIALYLFQAIYDHKKTTTIDCANFNALIFFQIEK